MGSKLGPCACKAVQMTFCYLTDVICKLQFGANSAAPMGPDGRPSPTWKGSDSPTLNYGIRHPIGDVLIVIPTKREGMEAKGSCRMGPGYEPGSQGTRRSSSGKKIITFVIINIISECEIVDHEVFYKHEGIGLALPSPLRLCSSSHRFNNSCPRPLR